MFEEHKMSGTHERNQKLMQTSGIHEGKGILKKDWHGWAGSITVNLEK
jgi:hypothetical protein